MRKVLTFLTPNFEFSGAGKLIPEIQVNTSGQGKETRPHIYLFKKQSTENKAVTAEDNFAEKLKNYYSARASINMEIPLASTT